MSIISPETPLSALTVNDLKAELNEQRHRLVNDGLLRHDAPRGVWAITEKGRDYLKQHDG